MRLTLLLLVLLALLLISECRRKPKPKPSKGKKPAGKKPGKKPARPAKPGKKPSGGGGGKPKPPAINYAKWTAEPTGGTCWWNLASRTVPFVRRVVCSVGILCRTNATKNIPPSDAQEFKATL